MVEGARLVRELEGEPMLEDDDADMPVTRWTTTPICQ